MGLKPINNIVDITNYVLLECGQPLHAFDFNRLEGKRIIVRNARKGEKILAIDDKDYQLTPEMLVIADEKNPVALAGIMGGKATEVTESTTDILLESASFEPKNIRRTSRQLKLASDSSYRFERNVPPVNMEWGSKRATALIREIAGGKVTVEKLVATREPTEKKVTINLDRVWRLIGIPIDKETIKRILKALGFVPVKEWRGNIDFKVPLFRTDINEAVDVIEEIVRVYGYDEVPMNVPITVPDVLEKLPGDELLNRVRDTLVGLGCFEALTNSFVDDKSLSDFPFWCDNPLDKAITFANTPMKLRNNLASALLAALRLNEGYQREAHIKFFEVAKVYYKDKASAPYEKFCLGLLDNRGFLSLKGTIEALLGRIKLAANISYQPYKLDWFKTGQCLKIKLGDQVLGYLGEINSPLIDKYQTTNRVALAELDWAVMVKNAQLAVTYREFPRLPAIQRDLALVVDEKVKWAQVAETIQKTGGDYLEKVNFFDLYRGSQVAKGKKSIACALVFRAPDRTLTNEEVDTTIKQIVESLGSNLAATLRS
ncbi:Phenylalanine--tRNA ligase beta subunit [subsurface metagenome]